MERIKKEGEGEEEITIILHNFINQSQNRMKTRLTVEKHDIIYQIQFIFKNDDLFKWYITVAYLIQWNSL